MADKHNGSFLLEYVDGKARAGTLETFHGQLKTPFFMPVATQGSVKSIDPGDLEMVESKIILGNAYHLYLRPGVDVVSNLGGLHEFMSWKRPILTDSGGYQGFSMRNLRDIDENGITFRSHIDGSIHFLSPEKIIEVQTKLGSDIMMPLDVCSSLHEDEETVRLGVKRTAEWLQRSLDCKKNSDQMLFGIIQGGISEELRKESSEITTGLDVSGYSIGGLSVGEPKAKLYEIAGFTSQQLSTHKPRYLMGVGSPEDLVECVGRGIDMFDCVLPTRVARNGGLYTRDGRVNIRSARYRNVDDAFDNECDCYSCTKFSTGYLHHLYRAREYLAYRLGSIHNLRFIMRIMSEVRESIMACRFDEYRSQFLARYNITDESVRMDQRKKWDSCRGKQNQYK